MKLVLAFFVPGVWLTRLVILVAQFAQSMPLMA